MGPEVRVVRGLRLGPYGAIKQRREEAKGEEHFKNKFYIYFSFIFVNKKPPKKKFHLTLLSVLHVTV